MSLVQSKYLNWVTCLAGSLFWLFLAGCTKEPSEFLLLNLQAGDATVSSSESPGGINVNAVFVATFNEEIDLSLIVPGAILLIQDYDQSSIDFHLTANENTLTITTTRALSSGASYKLVFSDRLMSHERTQLIPATRFFFTLGTFAPRDPVAHWNFEKNPEVQLFGIANSIDAMVDISYTDSRNAAAGEAATFDGNTSIIEIKNDNNILNAKSFSLCFWMKTNSVGHMDAVGNPAGYFVMGLGAFFGFQFEIASDFSWCNFVARYAAVGGVPLAEDLWFSGDGLFKGNGGWQGTTYCRDLKADGGLAELLKDKWAHIVYTFNGTSKIASIFINGELMKEINFSQWPEKDIRRNISGLTYDESSTATSNELVFGFLQSRSGTLLDSDPAYGYDFPTSNHFKGQLDDIWIYHKTLTKQEILMLYQAEK